jgi:hypothetical protein
VYDQVAVARDGDEPVDGEEADAGQGDAEDGDDDRDAFADGEGSHKW